MKIKVLLKKYVDLYTLACVHIVFEKKCRPFAGFLKKIVDLLKKIVDLCLCTFPKPI